MLGSDGRLVGCTSGKENFPRPFKLDPAVPVVVRETRANDWCAQDKIPWEPISYERTIATTPAQDCGPFKSFRRGLEAACAPAGRGAQREDFTREESRVICKIHLPGDAQVP